MGMKSGRLENERSDLRALVNGPIENETEVNWENLVSERASARRLSSCATSRLTGHRSAVRSAVINLFYKNGRKPLLTVQGSGSINRKIDRSSSLN